MEILDHEQFWAVLRDGLRFSHARADLSSGRWTVADMRARAKHGQAERRSRERTKPMSGALTLLFIMQHRAIPVDNMYVC